MKHINITKQQLHTFIDKEIDKYKSKKGRAFFYKKPKKFDEYMIQFKIKLLKKDYPICKELYSDLHKLDEKVQEISKLVDNNKD